jgi:TPR repeat protein
MQRSLAFVCAFAALACGGAPLPDPGPPPAPPPQPGEEPASDTAPPSGQAGEAAATPDCGDPDDCNNKGVSALLERKTDAAIPLLQRACDLGSGSGCFNLAGVLANEELGVKAPARSAAAYGRACELGDAKGCLGAGMASYEGGGVGKDPAEALRLFKKACDLGNAEACKNVAVLLWGGELVARDREAAIGYFRRACDGGYAEACDIVKEIDAQLAGGGEAAAPAGGIAGANLTVGSMSVNGMTVNDLECRLASMGFMAAMQLVGSIAAQKKAMDRCAPKGAAPYVKWTFSGGKAQAVEVTGANDTKLEKCVAKAAAKMESAMDGECGAYFLVGAEAGATAAYEEAKGGK